ncbi:MAG: PSD1 and planctomycete cytochrome C domain-containing protein [Planctomycetota bacterium]|nr:PSD1 and planctomycete cytochrome C domain-containing protein [Planctomycetota bacterium]
MPQILRTHHQIRLAWVTLCAIFASTAVVADEAAVRTRAWSLRDEFKIGERRENPGSDRENQPTWHFLRTTRSEGPPETRRWLRDGRYVPLTEQGDRLFGMPFDGWIFRLMEAESPVVSAALEEKPAGLAVGRGDIVIAPGPQHAVVVGWESPVSGKLEIRGSFEHAQPSRGIAWYVERGPAPDAERGFEPVSLANGQAVFGTETQTGTVAIEGQSIEAGEFVYFIVDALADGTNSPHPGDGTRLEVTITVRDAVVPPPPSFEKEIFPLLVRKCHDCHGADLQEARLDLRTPGAILRGGENGPAAVPKNAHRSLLIERVLAGEMPPRGNDPVTPEELRLLRSWIRSGLHVEPVDPALVAPLFSEPERDHWAFRPLKPEEPPKVRLTQGVAQPCDQFLFARLESQGLSFSPRADKQTLLRRLTFDLTGLPPTPGELAEFEANDDPGSYEQTVDRLLRSPQFGVRWGRYWLDVVGYTDTVTFDEDFGGPVGFIEDKWKYRDYVVNAFNADKPYDLFLQEQIAGDELVDWRNAPQYTPEILEKLVATGFLRTVEDVTVEDPRPFVIWSVVHETVEHVGTSVLGLTLQCARCHGHKFEPIPQRDYYSLMALFTPALNPANWKNARNRMLPDVVPPVVAEIQKHNAEIDRRVAQLQQEVDATRQKTARRLRDQKSLEAPEKVRAELLAALDTPSDKQTAVQIFLVDKFATLVKVEPAEIDASLTDDEKTRLKQNADEIARENGTRRRHGWIHAVYDIGPPPVTSVFKRGQFDLPGREVPPGFLRVLADSPDASTPLSGETPAQGSSGRRKALAHWLTARESPASALVARVMVNRVWQQLFGQGFVETSDNLGLSGARPTHPELLDWLADDFREQHWSVKRLIRQLVLSNAYCQQSLSSATVPEGSPHPAQIDPQNLLLWRMNLRRIDAEALRDAIVANSGLLDPGLGGPPSPLVYDLGTGAVSETPYKEQSSRARRSLYLLQRRLYNPSFLAILDKPTITRGVCRRDHSATPLQSLTLLNDRFLIEHADRCAGIVTAEGDADLARSITAVYRLLLARSPDDKERAWCDEFLTEQTTLLQSSGVPAGEIRQKSLAALCQVLWGTNEFLYLR